MKDILLYFFCGVGVMASLFALWALMTAAKDRDEDYFDPRL